MHLQTAVLRSFPTDEVKTDFVRGMTGQEFDEFLGPLQHLSHHEAADLLWVKREMVPRAEQHLPGLWGRGQWNTDDPNIMARIAEHCVHDETLIAIVHTFPSLPEWSLEWAEHLSRRGLDKKVEVVLSAIKTRPQRRPRPFLPSIWDFLSG